MDYVHRAEREARLARAISRMSASQRRRLFEIMGNPPKIENVGVEYWNGMQTELTGLLTSEMEGIFVDSALALVEATPAIGVDWALVNQHAADWARGFWTSGGGTAQWQYPAGLAVRFTERRKEQLGENVARFYEEGWNLGQLQQRLDGVFGPGWGETVATTETTRAAVQGERAVVEELAKEGIVMVEVWQTNNDELVCPICGPRHGKVEGDGWTKADGPPAHTRCRCWTTHELPVVAP